MQTGLRTGVQSVLGCWGPSRAGELLPDWVASQCTSVGAAAPACFFIQPLQPAAHSFPKRYAWVPPFFCQSRILLSTQAQENQRKCSNICSPWERHGNPLQYSFLESSMDRGAWEATVHGVAKSRTQPKRLHMHACNACGFCDFRVW